LTNGAEKLDPIWVRNDGVGKYEIIDGEHRWKAAKEVGWKRLRAFIIDMVMDDAKAFNVRKNRERGRLDAEKLGKILYEEYQTEDMTQNGVGKKFGLARETVRDYIEIYENRKKIRERLDIGAMAPLRFRQARNVLRELKHEERGEPPEQPSIEEPVESQQLESFLTRYAKALRKNPLPKVQKDEVQIAIDFFKRLLGKKKIHCLVCGENHLQWRCGHEF